MDDEDALMPYYDTIAEDLKRAREILERGRLRDEDFLIQVPTEIVREVLASGGGTIYGGDTYAAYKLLESFVAEIERRTAALAEGADPALGFCRICGTQAVPPYPGYYRDAVCSRECYDEWRWRETLHVLGRPYRPREG